MKLRNFLLCTAFILFVGLIVVPTITSENKANIEYIEYVITDSTSTLAPSYHDIEEQNIVYQHIADTVIRKTSTITKAEPAFVLPVDTTKFEGDSIELRKELVKEVYDYIYAKAPKMANEVSNHIVNIGLNNKFDICFMMAQAQLETNFGNNGSGQTRKSIFGARGKFVSYENCIESYVNMVQNNYLGKHKTEQHLLQNYVTIRGNHRYAENENYEHELKDVYNQIMAKTNIRNLQSQID